MLKRNWPAVAAALALAALFILYRPGAVPAVGAPADAAAPAKKGVATVNLKRLLDNLAETADLQVQYKAMIAAAAAEDATRGREIKDGLDNLKILPADKQVDESIKLEEKKAAYLRWKELTREKHGRITGANLERMYHEVEKAAAEVAKDGHYTAVLLDQAGAPFPSEFDGVELTIRTRSVIWSDPENDITLAVQQKMDLDYKNKPK